MTSDCGGVETGEDVGAREENEVPFALLFIGSFQMIS